MTPGPKPDPAPPDFAATWLRLNGSKEELKAHYAVGRVKIDRWINEVTDGATGQSRIITLDELPTGRPAEMLVERDLDPEEWQVRGLRVNEWEMGGDLQRQTRLDIAPRKPMLTPVRTEGYKPPKPKPRKKAGKNTLYVVTGDEQEPFADPALHTALINWLAEVKPDEGINLGDALDWPSVSKYRKRPDSTPSVRECMEALWKNICDRREASPDTRWRFMAGNHEARLENYAADQSPGLVGLTRVGEDAEILTPEYLMRFDELGIEYIPDYPNGRVAITPELIVRHGWIVKKNAAASARETLNHVNYSVIVGHVHRQGVTAHTVDGADGEPVTRWAAEAGCMCVVKGGLNHTTAPDWQQGFLTVQVHDDGSYLIEPAAFRDGYLHWRGDRWK